MGIWGSPDGAGRLFGLCMCPKAWMCHWDLVGTPVSCKETSSSITGKHFISNMRAGPKILLQVRGWMGANENSQGPMWATKQQKTMDFQGSDISMFMLNLWQHFSKASGREEICFFGFICCGCARKWASASKNLSEVFNTVAYFCNKPNKAPFLFNYK